MPTPFPIQYPYAKIADKERFDSAVNAFFEINQSDPNTLDYDGVSYPKAWLMARALVYRILELAPEASEALLLAGHCQHLKRWETPRSTYPEGKTGYLKWRSDLKVFHAEESAKVLKAHGYDEAIIENVKQINLKKDIKSSTEVQTMEDALCLVFLEFQFDDIIADHPEEKVIDIVQKTARKMSARGLEHASTLPLSERGISLLQKALS